MTYKEFIDNILCTRGRFNCESEYHERHHIIPRCVGGSNDKDNLIDLYAREHFEAHRLLALESPHNEGLQYAWWCMSTMENDDSMERYKCTAKEYEEIKIIYSKLRSESMMGEKHPRYGVPWNEEVKRKISENHPNCRGENNPFYGKTHSEETRRKLSLNKMGANNPMYGKSPSEETRRKISESHKKKYPKRDNDVSRDKSSLKTNGNRKIVICIETQEKFSSEKEAQYKTGIDNSSIAKCCKGKRKTAGGYHWQYINS